MSQFRKENHSALEENLCYECIENMWSWVTHKSIFMTFKRFEPEIRSFIVERLPAENSHLSADDRDIIVSFVMIQSFAYSYYLVMDLKSSIPSCININEITNTMVEVFAENRYIGDDSIADTDTIDIMISQKDQIVVKTLGRLLSNS